MGEEAVDPATLPDRIHHPLDHWARHRPDALALIESGGRRLTYGQLRDAVTAMAAILSAAGVRGGDRVIIVNENCAAAVTALFAVSLLDAWAVLVNARLAPVEIDRIRAHAQPRAMLFTHAISAEAAGHAERHQAGDIFESIAGPVRIAGQLPCVAEPVSTSGAGQVAAMIYTSGTTGTPKGVMLSHRNLMFAATVSGRLRGITADDFVMHIVPVSHVFGLSSIFICAITAGARILQVPRFAPAQLAEALRSGISVVQGVPAMYAKLLEYLEVTGQSLTAPRLRYISAGGSPLDIDWKRSIEQRFGLALNNGYGLTECAANVALTRLDRPRQDDSIGLPLPGVEMRFVGPDGIDVADGTVGEIWIKGPNVMLGYYRDDTATRAVLDADGWYRSGDLGRRGEDGHLYIVGRVKELIIRSGFNVYPAEVETALNSHDDVVQSAVIGRKVGGNEEVVALVEVKPGCGLQPSSLRDHVGDRLAAYKRPQHIFIVEKIPASPTGKILKAGLTALAEELIANSRG